MQVVGLGYGSLMDKSCELGLSDVKGVLGMGMVELISAHRERRGVSLFV